MGLLGNNPFRIETQICSISLYVVTLALVKFPLSGGNPLGLSRNLSITDGSQRAVPKLTEQGLGLLVSEGIC